jgi:methyl-accepting chemotaxis protein
MGAPGKTMLDLSDEDMEAVTDIRSAVFLISEKLRLGKQLSDDIQSTSSTIAGNVEFLKRYVAQIDRLKDNVADAASEMVASEISQLGASYDVLQDDYNSKMRKMRRFVTISTCANLLLTIFAITVVVIHLH